MKANKLILQGTKSPQDNLYDIQLPTNKINFIVRKDKTKLDLAQFYHATVFSPPISTFQKAIRKGNFVSWPGISDINFTKILGTTEANEKGHLDQERKGLQSTKTLPTILDHDNEHFPTKEPTSKSYQQFATILHPATTSKAYMDLTGSFPHSYLKLW